MPKKKLYMARFSDGRVRTFADWESCKKEVLGVQNVQFKGFAHREEADLWLKKFSDPQSGPADVRIYVDGSFTPREPRAGWGWVAVKDEQPIAEDCGLTPHAAESRNIDGELWATLQAVDWAMKNNQKVIIVYDYAGIEQWARKIWKAKSPVAQKYQQSLEKLNFPVNFEKIKGHSGDRWNDYADRLAQRHLPILE